MNTRFSSSARVPLAACSIPGGRGAVGELFLRGADDHNDRKLREFLAGTAPVNSSLRVVLRFAAYRCDGGERLQVAIATFSGSPAGLARAIDELFDGVDAVNDGQASLPESAQGYLCQMPEGALRCAWRDDSRRRTMKRITVSFIAGRTNVETSGVFRLYAGRQYVASFATEELSSELARYRPFLCPESVMAAKDEVRPGVLADLEHDPALLDYLSHLPREQAIEAFVGERAGDLLFQRIKAAGLVQPELRV